MKYFHKLWKDDKYRMKETLSPVFPTSVRVTLNIRDLFFAALLQKTFVFITLIRRSVRKHAGIHHAKFAATVWAFDMDHKLENIRTQLSSPLCYWLLMIYLLSVSLCMRAYVTANKTPNFSFPVVFITKIIVSCVQMVLWHDCILADLIQEDGGS